jgi:hypothetical protein
MGWRRKRCRCFRLNLGEPVEIGLEDITAKGVIDEFAYAPGLDQTGVLQFLHVMRECGRSDRQATSNISAGAGSVISTDLLEDLVTVRIGERTGDKGEFAVCKDGAFWCGHLTSTVIDREIESWTAGKKIGASCGDAPLKW